ncbi:LUD domain-containing protein [Enterovirga sp.]|uniref:LutC/YkgG family protein n=1 Tax=Enterovirga sp. TaxID=2026350 RepID=UPI002C503DF9|nr:LUD domain-containing protein [Enterovirga sp.]HMO30155.1 LUD domain-containing protein [Enterovirga sp.]
MTARDGILAAIRKGLGTPPGPGTLPQSPAAIAAEAASLLKEPDTTRPRLAAATLPDAFATKAGALGTTIDRVASMAEIPQAVRRYLDGHGLSSSVALQADPELESLDWAGLSPHASLAPDEPAAVGLALWGIAESGSLVIHSGPQTPILLSFLPLHHIVVLREETLLPYLEDYAAKLAGTAVPRNVVLITGPSGTTDIEGSYVRGAHGPGYLHVILVSPSRRPS